MAVFIEATWVPAAAVAPGTLAAGVPPEEANAMAVWVPAMISFISADWVEIGLDWPDWVGIFTVVPEAGRTQPAKINAKIMKRPKTLDFFMKNIPPKIMIN